MVYTELRLSIMGLGKSANNGSSAITAKKDPPKVLQHMAHRILSRRGDHNVLFAKLGFWDIRDEWWD